MALSSMAYHVMSYIAAALPCSAMVAAEGSGIVRSPPPPAIPQPPAPIQVPVYSTPLIRLGPFGQTAADMTSGSLDHWELAVGGARPITSIKVFSGSDPNVGSGATMFQIRYGDMDAPRVGRPSGSTEGSLQLLPGEYISAVWVSVDRPQDFWWESKYYAGERLQGVRFVSNTGRSVTAGEYGGGGGGGLCPADGYTPGGGGGFVIVGEYMGRGGGGEALALWLIMG